MATINVYGLGGTGINITSIFNKRGKESSAIGDIVPYFIDTSRSDIGGIDSQNNVVVIDGVAEGSGKLRTVNLEPAKEAVRKIIYDFKPADDLNIVVHSVAGGSGSVLGPLIVRELLAAGKNVATFLIGNTTSEKEVDNCIKTLQWYQNISDSLDKPVVAFYRENGGKFTRKQNDEAIRTAIIVLATFFSGKNIKLDKQDLYHFINYNRVTSIAAGLVGLEFFDTVCSSADNQPLYSVVTLAPDDSHSTDPGVMVQYHAEGFLSEENSKAFQNPHHIATVGNYFYPIVQELNKRLAEFHAATTVVKAKRLDAPKGDDVGFVA